MLNGSAHPGEALGYSVGVELQRDWRRGRDRTDAVDLDHIKHFPYVDFATCDRRVYPVVTRKLADALTLRKVTLVKTNALSELVSVINSAEVNAEPGPTQ